MRYREERSAQNIHVALQNNISNCGKNICICDTVKLAAEVNRLLKSELFPLSTDRIPFLTTSDSSNVLGLKPLCRRFDCECPFRYNVIEEPELVVGAAHGVSVHNAITHGASMKKYLKTAVTIVASLALIFFAIHAHAQSESQEVGVSDDAKQASSRPNILVFMTDDESWLERSAYGWSNLPTPNFDRVAREGVLFTNAYTSAPSCAPSRASFLTGRNFWELEAGAFIQAHLPKRFPVYPALLANHGYVVGQTGKVWGPGTHPKNVGWPDELVPGSNYMDREIPTSQQNESLSVTDYAANFADFLEQRDSQKPFCFFAGTHEPHLAWDPDNHKRLKSEFGFDVDDVKVPEMVEDTPETRLTRANFLYEICYADRQLGEMLDSLEERGLLANTLVVVTSDNGTSIASGGANSHLVGKASHYEWGTHEPLAIMWPAKVPAGRTVTDFVNFADFAPTFLSTAGVDVPPAMTGRSLLPLLLTDREGRIEPTRNAVYTGLEWHGEMDPISKSFRAIRGDDFYYAAMYDNVDQQGNPLNDDSATKPANEALYDVKNDPWQLKNLAADPEYASQKQNMADRMRMYGLETSDPRATGDMGLFRDLRHYVQERKKLGYEETLELPFHRSANN